MSDEVLDELREDIDQVVNEDIMLQKQALGLRNQRVYCVRSGFNGLLDVARLTYKEATDDVHDLSRVISFNKSSTHQSMTSLLS
jgi:DNA mismatch repair protein MSH4